MKCIVRVRDQDDVEVFVPKKNGKTEELLQNLYEKETVKIEAREVEHFSDMKHISIDGKLGHTEFYIRTLVEVDI